MLFINLKGGLTVYSLVVISYNFSERYHILGSMALACVMATALFYLAVAPAHNLLKAFIAYRQGDEKVKVRGYLRFLPKKSFNWIGVVSSLFLFMPIVHPVYYRNSRFYKPNKGVFAVALSGIAFYFVSGVLLATIYTALKASAIYGVTSATDADFAYSFSPLVYHFILSTVYFLSRICFFSTFINLLPVTPMDMGEVLGLILRINWVDYLKNNETFISALIFLGSFFTVAKPSNLFSQLTLDIMNFLALMF